MSYSCIFIFQQKFIFYCCIYLLIKRKDNFNPYSDFSSMGLIKANGNLAYFIDMESPLLTPPK